MHTKKQHFVPQFYLKNFAHSRNKLWICMRDSPREDHIIHEVNIKRACAENYLYEIPLHNSANSTFFEQGTTEAALAGIESLFAPSVKYFLECSWDTLNKRPEELWGHADNVVAFAANLIVRNPKWIKQRRSFAPALTRQLQSNGFFIQNELFELEKLGYSSDLESVVEFGIQHAELSYSNSQSSTMRLTEALLEMSFILL